jgi:hypothetical protein
MMAVKCEVMSWRMYERTEKNHDTMLIICSLPGIGIQVKSDIA